MADIERLTVTLPADLAAVLREAVNAGDYASTSEAVREAVRDWRMKRLLQIQELAVLKAEVEKGPEDVAAGRVRDFDPSRIVERGRRLSAGRTPSV
jgi:antitoxin ParD1/3/4